MSKILTFLLSLLISPLTIVVNIIQKQPIELSISVANVPSPSPGSTVIPSIQFN